MKQYNCYSVSMVSGAKE